MKKKFKLLTWRKSSLHSWQFSEDHLVSSFHLWPSSWLAQDWLFPAQVQRPCWSYQGWWRGGLQTRSSVDERSRSWHREEPSKRSSLPQRERKTCSQCSAGHRGPELDQQVETSTSALPDGSRGHPEPMWRTQVQRWGGSVAWQKTLQQRTVSRTPAGRSHWKTSQIWWRLHFRHHESCY